MSLLYRIKWTLHGNAPILVRLKSEKMETTLLRLAMPGVLNKIKELLIHEGFIVQTIPTADPVLVAEKSGSWLRSARQLIIEVTSENKNMTRINITAIIKNKKNSQLAEEILEENFASKLYNIFNKVIQKTYGI